MTVAELIAQLEAMPRLGADVVVRVSYVGQSTVEIDVVDVKDDDLNGTVWLADDEGAKSLGIRE